MGSAMKATFAVVNGVGHEMTKDPVTDTSKTKKSATGLLKVLKSMEPTGEKYNLVDKCDWDEEDTGELKLRFEDGNLLNEVGFQEIKDKIWAATAPVPQEELAMA
jgi:nicotinamide phosphoribosyltransferase